MHSQVRRRRQVCRGELARHSTQAAVTAHCRLRLAGWPALAAWVVTVATAQVSVGASSPCEPNPCLNGGNCTTSGNNTNNFICDCPKGYRPPVCEGINCSASPPEHGTIEGGAPRNAVYGDGTQVTFQCDAGYKITGGSPTVQCNTSGVFPSPFCQPKPCAPRVIEHAFPPHGLRTRTQVQCSGTTLDKCFYRCAQGFTNPSPGGYLICQPNGKFSAGECRAIRCANFRSSKPNNSYIIDGISSASCQGKDKTSPPEGQYNDSCVVGCPEGWNPTPASSVDYRCLPVNTEQYGRWKPVGTLGLLCSDGSSTQVADLGSGKDAFVIVLVVLSVMVAAGLAAWLHIWYKRRMIAKTKEQGDEMQLKLMATDAAGLTSSKAAEQSTDGEIMF